MKKYVLIIAMFIIIILILVITAVTTENEIKEGLDKIFKKNSEVIKVTEVKKIRKLCIDENNKFKVCKNNTEIDVPKGLIDLVEFKEDISDTTKKEVYFISYG